MPAPIDFMRLLQELRADIRTIQARLGRVLDNTGLSVPGPGVVNVDGSLVVQSGEARSGNYSQGATGWRLRPDGTIEMNDAEIRGGIIGNDALTNPVIPGSVWAEASDFTVSPAWSTIITRNVTVPAGCTAASVHAQGRVTAFYNNAGTGSGVDYLFAHLYVAANSSGFYPLAATDNGGSGTNHVFRDAVLTGLTPGSTFALDLQASTSSATWTNPSSPGNQATLGATIQWYR